MFKALIAAGMILAQTFHPLSGIQGKFVLANELIKRDPVNSKLDFMNKMLLPYRVGAADQYYYAPNASEIYKLIQGVKNDLIYTPEVYDCDDYSYWFKGELQRQWRKAGHVFPLPIIQVFGVIKIHATGELVGHAWNGIVTSDGTVVWIEPQGPYVMNPSKFDVVQIYSFWI